MSFETPEVSIIIPLYNAEDYIKVTLKSLQQQTFQDFEVVVVDDCSTDKSLNSVKKFRDSEDIGSKIKIIELEKNGGISNTRNVGLHCSRGKYITFLDNDDMLMPNALETFFNLAEKYQAEIVHTHSHYQNEVEAPVNKDAVFLKASFEHGNKKNLTAPPYYLTNDMTERMNSFSVYGIDWNVWGKFFRRDFLMTHNVHFPKIQLTEDLLFCFQCLIHSKKYLMIPDSLYIYRFRADSTLRKERDKSFLKKIIGVQIQGTRLLNEYMDEVEHFKDHFKDREKAINFYLNLELLATKLMQKRYGQDEDYFKILQEFYSEHFGKDAAFVSFIHRIVNQTKS